MRQEQFYVRTILIASGSRRRKLQAEGADTEGEYGC